MRKRPSPIVFLIVLSLLPSFSLFAAGRQEKTSRGEPAVHFTSKSLVRILEERNDVTFIASALRQSGLAKQMAELDGYTLFVPTDDVIARLPERARKALSSDPQALLDVLTAQMVKGIVTVEELRKRPSIETLSGIRLQVGSRNGRITIADSDLISEDLFGNGFLVHVVTGIIVPGIKL